MNYYEHHLGDYLRDTAHLSLVEDGAYRRLLDLYYIRERPLPADPKECFKLARALSKQERDAVQYVLRSFFELRDDGYHQARADVEIARFSEKKRKAAASANARWDAVRTQSVDDADAMRTHCEGNALQSPVPIKNSPTPRKRGAGASPTTTIPSDFAMDDPLRKYAADHLPNVDADELFEKFRDQAITKAWRNADWRRAFQTYVRNCAPNSGHWAAGQYPKNHGGIQWQ